MFEYGQQIQMARAAGVAQSQLNEIVNGKKNCPSKLAVKLELVSEEVLGRKVLAKEWILMGLGIKSQEATDVEGTTAAES